MPDRARPRPGRRVVEPAHPARRLRRLHPLRRVSSATSRSRPTMLARRLKALVDAGLLERRRYCEHPPRDEYVLTERGREFRPVLLALYAWVYQHVPARGAQPRARRPRDGRRDRAGASSTARTGRPLEELRRGVRARPGGQRPSARASGAPPPAISGNRGASMIAQRLRGRVHYAWIVVAVTFVAMLGIGRHPLRRRAC